MVTLNSRRPEADLLDLTLDEVQEFGEIFLELHRMQIKTNNYNEMKTVSISELRKELNTYMAPEIIEICIRLVKYKKENKELLTYILYKSDDEPEYIRNIKQEIEEQFEAVNQGNIYFAKKTIRKILLMTNKYIRYSGSKRTETELLIHYLTVLRNSGIPIQKSTSLCNLYDRQIRKIRKVIATLHEDLQYDFSEKLEPLLDLENYTFKKRTARK